MKAFLQSRKETNSGNASRNNKKQKEKKDVSKRKILGHISVNLFELLHYTMTASIMKWTIQLVRISWENNNHTYWYIEDEWFRYSW